MSETMSVKVQLADKTIRDCAVEASHAPPWKLICSGIDADRRGFDGDDLFEAMIGLRKELEGLGCLLLCAGARADVFPSGMSRSMAGGRKAYVTRLGMPAGRSDVVDIFDYAGPESVGTVEQQREFHQKWIVSQGGQAEATKSLPGEVEEAKRNPSGWVYRIAGRFAPSDAVPPEAIIGAWKVDPQGNIIGGFIKNAKYDPKRWPAAPT
jgi:hypothetical protein